MLQGIMRDKITLLPVEHFNSHQIKNLSPKESETQADIEFYGSPRSQKNVR